MIFKLENVGKIKRAEVELHGITVVAGNNRTGKSTVGKMLYCIFSAFKNESVFQERANIFEDILSDLFFHKLKIRTYMTPKKIFYDISEENLEQKIEELVSYGINNKIDFPEIQKNPRIIVRICADRASRILTTSRLPKTSKVITTLPKNPQYRRKSPKLLVIWQEIRLITSILEVIHVCQ